MELPLKHLRVLDLSSGPVGGMATMALADFGADVIKSNDQEEIRLEPQLMRQCGSVVNGP